MISQQDAHFSRAGASSSRVSSFCLGSEGGNYPLMLLESLFVSADTDLPFHGVLASTAKPSEQVHSILCSAQP